MIYEIDLSARIEFHKQIDIICDIHPILRGGAKTDNSRTE
jgi:acyl carrier protein phosphodiesterase